MLFWFGADAVRYLLPSIHYEMYFLWPGLIYELLVVVGVAPDSAREVGGYEQIWKGGKAADSAHSLAEETFLDENVDGEETTADTNEDLTDSLLAAF